MVLYDIIIAGISIAERIKISTSRTSASSCLDTREDSSHVHQCGYLDLIGLIVLTHGCQSLRVDMCRDDTGKHILFRETCEGYQKLHM